MNPGCESSRNVLPATPGNPLESRVSGANGARKVPPSHSSTDSFIPPEALQPRGFFGGERPEGGDRDGSDLQKSPPPWWPPGTYPSQATDFRIGKDGRRRVYLFGRWRCIVDDPRTCVSCGRTFWVTTMDADDRIICGQVCRDRERSKRNAAQVGEANSNWKGGVSTDNMRYRRRALERNPIKERVRYLTRLAIARGELVPEPCEKCGDPHSMAHHDSYSLENPLDVRWLCKKDHEAHHGRGVGAEPKREAKMPEKAA